MLLSPGFFFHSIVAPDNNATSLSTEEGPSSRYIGLVAILITALPCVIMIVLDIITVEGNIAALKRNVKNKNNQ